MAAEVGMSARAGLRSQQVLTRCFACQRWGGIIQPMKLFTSFSILGVLLPLLIITAIVVFYAQGWRLDLTKGAVEKTGIVLIRSVPEGAKVRLNDELITATDSPIPDLKPGTYRLKVEKEGYFPWEKDVPVEEGFVTDITALLPPLSPSLTAVTQKGARLVTKAPSGSKAIFVSGKELYLLNLSNPALGFLRTTPQKIAEESTNFPLAEATALRWSPNEDQILVSVERQHYLVSATGRNGSPTPVTAITDLLDNWDITATEQKTTLITRLASDEEQAAEAIKPTALWSPDEQKFLYVKEVDGKRQFWVTDLSDPLPIGDSAHQLVTETENAQLQLFWLADSHHFVMIDNGTVSLLDLDGSNKRTLFRGTLAEDVALSTMDLSKIIILTSIAPETPANLYAISLR